MLYILLYPGILKEHVMIYYIPSISSYIFLECSFIPLSQGITSSTTNQSVTGVLSPSGNQTWLGIPQAKWRS